MNIEKTNVNYAEIQEKLRAMKGLAAKRMSAGQYWFEVNGNKRYVRINSDNFRAVSLDAQNPCGRLIRDEKKVGRKILKSALMDARDVHCKNHLPGNTKPEHRVQKTFRHLPAPIHSFAPKKYESLFANVVCREDGEWWVA